MQFEFNWLVRKKSSTPKYLQLANQQVPVLLVKNVRAKRYVLRLRPDGTARVTVPARGTISEAWDFLLRHTHWIEKQIARLSTLTNISNEWEIGTEILFRGQLVKLEDSGDGDVRFSTEEVKISEGSLRKSIQLHLWKIAVSELHKRTCELALLHNVPIKRVRVRNQRSRWGSCSARGTICLNWRLIQTPPYVSDYIILHELMHLRQMNHSKRFWQEVEKVCPDYVAAEKWLKAHSSLLR